MAFAPADEQELSQVVAAAAAEARPLRITGSGSKAGIGRPSIGEELSLRALSGVVLYEPEELVLIAGAATPIAGIEALLASHNQHLAFEPMDCGPLLGAGAGQGTVGGLVAVNASGPRRIKAGAARDHVLGFRCVTGRGEIVKSGGRVMKNVTGYDLSKLVAGSFGTLAALTQITLKTLPAPETSQTLVLLGTEEQAGLLALRKVSGAPLEASALALLPKGAAPLDLGENAAAIRLEGPEISVAQRLEDLRGLLKPFGGGVEILGGESSASLWRALRDAEPVASLDGHIWRVSVAPSDGFALVSALKESALPLLGYFYDWAGGLVWLCMADAEDAHAKPLRAAVDRLGGHATLIRASATTRAAVDVFHPQPPALAALSRRVKESFDPAHILERGRLRAEF
ncbi:glycolate oxidase subunit GlcE [Methylocystis heyeri]|uniref:Glycolate oxidase subunit GlcE n=1 Tax=Methylocystis heyeri TaxID=391905 RepID=A0A6B8KH55_9HYPH|nr:glycolate oxidase subunit GlcE [Methylocystis heyeri]QGM46321.1 glycolate oxidase subunit GlcE [Methylocystis heyeri]